MIAFDQLGLCAMLASACWTRLELGDRAFHICTEPFGHASPHRCDHGEVVS